MAEKQFYVKLHCDISRWEVVEWDGEDEPEDIGKVYHRGPFDTWGRASECGHEDFSSYAPLVSIIDTADDAVAVLKACVKRLPLKLYDLEVVEMAIHDIEKCLDKYNGGIDR